jgi:hypothetical protein
MRILSIVCPACISSLINRLHPAVFAVATMMLSQNESENFSHCYLRIADITCAGFSVPILFYQEETYFH